MKLQNKILILLLPTHLVVAGLILFLIHKSVHSALMNDLVRNVLVATKATAQDAAPGFAAGKESLLLPKLQLLQNQEGGFYAAALDAQGKVLAHTAAEKKGWLQKDPITQAALRSDRPTVDAIFSSGKPVLEVDVPVWSAPKPTPPDHSLYSDESRAGSGTRLGLLKLGAPLEPFLETENRILRRIFLIFAVIEGVALGLLLILFRGILRPVNDLMAGISRLSEGRYDIEIPVVSKDELGDLARSFNDMSAELACTTVSKNYVEGILERMIDLLVVTDSQGKIETMNPAMLEALSYSAEEITGLPLATIFRDAPAMLGSELRTLPEIGDIRDLEAMLQTKSGRTIPVLFSASILNDQDGRLRGYVGVAKDMTERKKTERALLAAKAAAEASSKELEAFSYSVAHDLRAPLRAMDGFSQVLLDCHADKLDEEGKDFLRRVRGGSRRMGQLIDDLLSLSRITRTALRLEPVDLSGLAREIGAEFKKINPERAVTFSVGENLTAEGDPNLLRIVLINLLGNAWKYTSRKPVARIEFGLARREGAPAYFVRDDGAGFDMAFSNKLFKPFSRLHSAAEFEGNGIGLATVLRALARHDGRIWGEGAAGKGATFFFTLWEGNHHGHENNPAG
ncbi:MAG: PAS domain S-box protein [Elusimicrobia bacterium]|nr:PAS domain S-box protein [Elusimicrobiota bacterium]